MNDIHERPSGRHPVNIGNLVMGIAFLGIIGVWALVQTDTVNGDDIHWLMPIPWVAAGVVGLIATAITGPRRYATRHTGWAGAPPEGPGWVDPRPEDPDERSDPDEPTHDLPKYPETSRTPEEMP